MSSRSQIRLAFDALTSRPAATAARFSGPRVATITRTRNCGTVTVSSTSATDAAAIATRAREARITASTWAAATVPAALRPVAELTLGSCPHRLRTRNHCR